MNPAGTSSPNPFCWISSLTVGLCFSLFHVTSHPGIRAVAGLQLGRCSDVPDNDPDFVLNEEEVARHWCAKAGIAWLGRADIGHDADNKVVPFG